MRLPKDRTGVRSEHLGSDRRYYFPFVTNAISGSVITPTQFPTVFSPFRAASRKDGGARQTVKIKHRPRSTSTSRKILGLSISRPLNQHLGRAKKKRHTRRGDEGTVH